MPEGSSSEAPVTRPGPSRASILLAKLAKRGSMVGEVGVAQPGADSYDAPTFDVAHEWDLTQSLDNRVVVHKRHDVPVTVLQANLKSFVATPRLQVAGERP
jgi:hypothetical protein